VALGLPFFGAWGWSESAELVHEMVLLRSRFA